MSRKEWSKPELTVLVRSNPEEAVLAVCKLPGGEFGIEGPGADSCFAIEGAEEGCQALSAS